ncbi:MAG: class I SAM-dependent methyltransferase [Verrucomicrobiota bacterium]
MYGTKLAKVTRLVGDLLGNPKYVPGYLSTNFSKRTPLDLELPWFSYAAIDFLAAFLRPEMCVFEYGTGGSTLFLARKVRTVTSIEDNVVWLQKIEERLRQTGLSNVVLQHRQFDSKNPVNFESSGYLHSIPSRQFDMIVVDGTEEFFGQRDAMQVRPICFRHAEKFIRPGGIIVVDDSWCYPDLRRLNRARRYRTFKSAGPCRPGVTSTDIFFY